MEISELHSLFLQSKGICTDTRKIFPDCIFVALKGDNFDANIFATKALELGAAYVVADDASAVNDNRIILFPDSLKALQDLASFHRNHLALPIIALTGSNGKTTTKDLINVVLSQKFKTGATVGNLNNHIGVPLTLLSFTAQTQIGIVEMGANHQKEIEALCAIAQPDFGYITNFGKAHLEGFGGVEGVIKGKSELYDYLRSADKLAFVNGDDFRQMEKTSGMHRCIFGTSTDAEVFIEDISADPYVKLSWKGQSVVSNLIGIYNAPNVSAALAMGHFFDIDPHDCALAIASYIPQNNRSQIIEKTSNRIILDAYNANPSSMDVAITNFLGLSSDKSKVMILGDMFELGEESDAEHKALVDRLKSETAASVYFIGPSFGKHQQANANVFFFETLPDFMTSDHLKQIRENLVLIKGSRGMALEHILEHLD